MLIAGGIGITPMMSVVRSLTDRGWRGEIYLLFSVRLVRDIVFRDELAYLQARFPNLHVRVVVTRDPETAWDGPRGQITREMIAAFVPELTQGPVLLCGPAPMMTAMRELLVEMGVPDDEIQQEAFVSPPPVEAGAGTDVDAAVERAAARRRRRPASCSSAPARPPTLPWTQTVLEAAEEAGVDIPFECRSGICGQCKTQLDLRARSRWRCRTR